MSPGVIPTLTSEETSNVLAGCMYMTVCLLLIVALWMLTRMARKLMQPRPRYVKADPLFRSHKHGQNWNWDWVLVFRVQEAHEVLTEFQIQYSMRKIVERLEAGKLETNLFLSHDYDLIFCKIRCDLGKLKDQAANEEYKCLMNPDKVKSTIEKGSKNEIGKYKWYPRRRKWTLPESGPAKKEYNTEIIDSEGQSSYEYNQFIYGKYNKRAELQVVYKKYLVSNSIFRGVDRLKLMMGIMEGDFKQQGCSLDIHELISEGAVLAAFPLHDDDQLAAIQDKWITYFAPPWNQPIDLVKDYFGEKVGMYFLFLGTYSGWLFTAAFAGIIAYFCAVIPGPLEGYATLIMAVFMSVWSTFFLESWKATQARHKMQWGMTGFEDSERDRTEFEGRELHSPVTGLPEKYFPDSEKMWRSVNSYVQIALCMVYISTVNAGVFFTYAFLAKYPYQNYTSFGLPNIFSVPRVVMNLALALIIQITNGMFMPLAITMNETENHRTETQYFDNLIGKVFVFQFVNSYGALFYVAMLQSALAYELGIAEPWRMRRFDCQPKCLADVGSLLGTIFICRVVLGNIQEIVLPYFRMSKRLREKRDGDDDAPDDDEYENPHDEQLMRKRQVSPVEEQFLKDDYNALSLFNDYSELVIQFGYATLFVSAFPLAPMFACAANFVEIRVDGWKLCQVCRRPWPQGAEDIGTWEDILTIVSIIATITNAVMVTLTSDMFVLMSTTTRILVFIALEWALIGLKVGLMVSLDSVPSDVLMQIERQKFFDEKIVQEKVDEEKDIDEDINNDIDESAVPILSCDPHIKFRGKDGNAESENDPKRTQQQQEQKEDPDQDD